MHQHVAPLFDHGWELRLGSCTPPINSTPWDFVLLTHESRGGDVIDGGFTGIPVRTTTCDGEVLLPSNSHEFVNWEITTLICTVHATAFYENQYQSEASDYRC